VTAIWVALAGGVGAIARYVADSLISARWPTLFPAGTLAVNASGSLILGVLVGLVIVHGAPADLRTVAGTGFCGGYTTFSAASVESLRLAQQRQWLEFLSYTIGSIVMTLLAAGAGLWLTGVR
jgi:CrcB protein